MTESQEETLEALLQRHADGNDLPRFVPQIRFADAMARGDDPLHILPYFADVDVQVRSMEDLLEACNDPAEEEIDAFRVDEGVAVYQAVDGLWLLFTR